MHIDLEFLMKETKITSFWIGGPTLHSMLEYYSTDVMLTSLWEKLHYIVSKFIQRPVFPGFHKILGTNRRGDDSNVESAIIWAFILIFLNILANVSK